MAGTYFFHCGRVWAYDSSVQVGREISYGGASVFVAGMNPMPVFLEFDLDEDLPSTDEKTQYEIAVFEADWIGHVAAEIAVFGGVSARLWWYRWEEAMRYRDSLKSERVPVCV